MEDITLHSWGHVVAGCCKGQAWQPAGRHQHRSCTHKLQGAEAKWIDLFKSILNHWFKETPEFTHLMAQHIKTQQSGLTSLIKEYFIYIVIPTSTMVGLRRLFFSGFFSLLIFLTCRIISKQKRLVRDNKGFARNVSIKFRFCLCKMSLTLSVTKTIN